jgi:hypothetical protein
MLDKLPLTYYVVADAAYAVSDKILVPFTGSQKRNLVQDAFNYFLSQLRIRIEQSFGLLVGKWRILRKPLECDLCNSSTIILACCRLHNYVIEKDWERTNDDDANLQITKLVAADVEAFPENANNEARKGLGYLPTGPDDEDVEQIDEFTEGTGIPGTSAMRDAIVQYVRARGLRRRVT